MEVVDRTIVVSHGRVDSTADPVGLEDTEDGRCQTLKVLTMVGAVEAQIVVKCVESFFKYTTGLNRFKELISEPFLERKT